MTEKLKKTTRSVAQHVARARATLDTFEVDQAAIKMAAEELRKAIALIERTKWKA
jgi:hypothetical protein